MPKATIPSHDPARDAFNSLLQREPLNALELIRWINFARSWSAPAASGKPVSS